MIRTTVYLTEYQHDVLKNISYEGKARDKKPGDTLFSEHIRKAVRKYLDGVEKEV